MIKKFVSLIFFIALLLFSVSFAVSNHQTVLTLGLFPLPGPGLTFPAYLWLFAVFVFGVLAGFILCWFGGLKKRHKIHEANNRAATAERELAQNKALQPIDENQDLNRALAKLP